MTQSSHYSFPFYDAKTISTRWKTLLVGLTFSLLFAQAIAQESSTPRLEVEIDPLAYILKGYSFHAAMQYGSFRSSAGIFAISQPAFVVNNDAFSVYSSGFDVKTDFLFGTSKAWHTGLQVSYAKEQITLRENSNEQNVWGFNLGVRGGYRFLFGKAEKQYKGLYINPWLAILYAPSAKSINISQQTYKQSTIFPFPAVHVGWRF
ncbi:hypothetical protein [Sphingobacterium corticibacter]|uniref:hypothetical protein n=1 Tax=Sphingobacterium corticibacter TaxID=2171749 RepID=UPI000E315CEE|nr:hypothetical protein [Sphingobacterium corticibacter]